MFSMPYEMNTIISNLRLVILCLGFLIGIGAGVFLIVRKRMVPGILTLAGFLLFSLNPIVEFVVFRVLWEQLVRSDDYLTANMISNCLTGFSFFLGSIALVVAFILMLRPTPNPPENNIFPG